VPAEGDTPYGRRYLGTDRLAAFSDGVFSIAATLLALDLAVHPPGTPLQQVLHAWPAETARSRRSHNGNSCRSCSGYVIAILIGLAVPVAAVALYFGIAVYLIVPFRESRTAAVAASMSPRQERACTSGWLAAIMAEAMDTASHHYLACERHRPLGG
jgi:hypothetical protein